MPLRPDDVIRKTFSTKLKGYSTTEVDDFLNEVVQELRRLHAEVDDLRAGATSMSADIDDRVVMETQQLDQIRRERADLVADLQGLQERYDSLAGKVRALESSAGPGHR